LSAHHEHKLLGTTVLTNKCVFNDW